MKRALVFMVALLMMAVVGVAGPYFVLENEGLALEPALTFGADWETVIGAVEGPSFAGDFWVGFDNILAPIAIDNLWTVGLTLDLDWGAVRCEFDSEIVINPRFYPDSIEILPESNFGVRIIGVPGEVVEVWGGVRLEYAPISWSLWPYIPAVPAAWEPILFFGIEVHLE